MSRRSKKHKQGLPKAFYTKVRPMAESRDMFQAAKVALQTGVKEVHLGWTRCALCGEELGPAVESDLLTDAGAGSPKVQVHLCGRCWHRYKASQRRN